MKPCQFGLGKSLSSELFYRDIFDIAVCSLLDYEILAVRQSITFYYQSFVFVVCTIFYV